MGENGEGTLAYLSELAEKGKKDERYKELSLELTTLYHNECDNMKRHLIRQLIRQDLDKGCAPSALQELQKRVKPSKEKTYFITIGFKKGITPKDTIEVIKKGMSKKWIINYSIAHEQRGETLETMGEGYHIHVLAKVEPKKKKCEMIRELANTFKSYVEGDNYIDIRPVTNNVENVEKYMQGEKKDANKKPKAEIDKVFNQKYFASILIAKDK